MNSLLNSSSSNRKIPLICSGHSRPIPEFAYSPLIEDGFFLVSACLDGKPMLRNGITGDWIGTFIGHKGAVWSVHINSKATQTITGSADYTSKLWSSITGEEIHSFQHSKIVKSVKFSYDDCFIVTGGQDKIIRIFDLHNYSSEPLQLEGHSQSIKNILWSPKNKNILFSIGQDDITIKIWDIRTLSEIHQNKMENKLPINSIDISWDEKYISTSSGKQIIFWNIEDFQSYYTHLVSYEVNTASLSPDLTTFITGSNEGWARVYSFHKNNEKELEIHKGHHGPIHCVKFAPDGATFASGSEDGTIRLWQSGEIKTYGLWQEINHHSNNNINNNNNKIET